jgi:putative phosphoesterase
MRALIERLEPNMVIYLGDGIDDILSLEGEFPKLRFEYVKGNCDIKNSVASEKIIAVDGFTFLLMHGHMYADWLGTDKLAGHARRNGASLLLHGHTHTPTLWNDRDVFIMNPGCIRVKFGKGYPTCGLVRTYETHFTCQVLFANYWISGATKGE